MPDLPSFEVIVIIFAIVVGFLRWLGSKLLAVGRTLSERSREAAREGEMGVDEESWETIEDPIDRELEPYLESEPVFESGPVLQPAPTAGPMTASELRDYLRGVEARPTAPPPPPPERSVAQPEPSTVERQRGAELVRTASTTAYDIGTNAYAIETDAYAIGVDAYAPDTHRRRRHPLVSKIDRKALKRAVLWREILSPPIALRRASEGESGQ